MARTSFKPLLERAELPDIRFHDLRHTCATLLLSRGHHPKLVQELLGHSSVAMTLDRYSHVLPGMGDRPLLPWRPPCPEAASSKFTSGAFSEVRLYRVLGSSAKRGSKKGASPKRRIFAAWGMRRSASRV